MLNNLPHQGISSTTCVVRRPHLWEKRPPDRIYVCERHGLKQKATKACCQETVHCLTMKYYEYLSHLSFLRNGPKNQGTNVSSCSTCINSTNFQISVLHLTNFYVMTLLAYFPQQLGVQFGHLYVCNTSREVLGFVSGITSVTAVWMVDWPFFKQFNACHPAT